jgi:transcriptional regulator with XRE-family HTH domain
MSGEEAEVKDAMGNPEIRRTYEEEVLYGEAVETIGALVANAGITQRELARRLEVSEARVSQILAGGVNLTLRSLADIGWALGFRFELDSIPMTKAERVGTPAVADPPAPEWLNRMPRNASAVRFNRRIELPSKQVRREERHIVETTRADCRGPELTLAA